MNGGGEGIQCTLERTEATVHDQLEIAKVTLGQDDSREGLGLCDELVMARSIASDEVLEDTTVGGISHFERMRKG